MRRRAFLKTAGTGLLALSSRVRRALAAGEPIRIGLLSPLTGVIAAGGRELVDGFNLYWDQVGRKAGGREIEVVVEDDASNPNTALQKARRLVEQRNVHMLVGDILANTGLAVAEYVKGNGVPYFIPVIAADDLTQRKRIPNVIRIAGYSAIQSLNPDAVFAMETGADGSRFIQQWANFGLKDKIRLFTSMNATDQSIIRTLGPEAEGVLSAGHFCEGRDDAANKKFVADYEKAFGKLPSIYAFSHYSGAMWLAQAFEAIGGKVEDRPRFLEAVRKIKLSASPLGREVSLDKYGNPVYDIYIRKVARRADGKLWNVPVEVYQGVSQFWKYDPEQYMKQPPYSREFQGIKKA